MSRLNITLSRAELEAKGYRVEGNRVVRVEGAVRTSIHGNLRGVGHGLTDEARAEVWASHSAGDLFPAPKYGLAPNGRPYRSKSEARYAEYLEVQRRAGLVVKWDYEALTLLLGIDVRYTPDFVVVMPNQRVEAHEIKANNWWRMNGDTAKTKLRVAPPIYPWLVFRGLTYDAGQWKVVETHNANRT